MSEDPITPNLEKWYRVTFGLQSTPTLSKIFWITASSPTMLPEDGLRRTSHNLQRWGSAGYIEAQAVRLSLKDDIAFCRRGIQ